MQTQTQLVLPGLEPGQMLMKLPRFAVQVEEEFRLQLQTHRKVLAQEEELNRA